MPHFNENIRDFYTGELAGATSATPFPTTFARWVNIKAKADNGGRVYIGKSGVTVPAETTDTTSGWPLAAGEETGWLLVPGNELESIYYICDNLGDALSYIYKI